MKTEDKEATQTIPGELAASLVYVSDSAGVFAGVLPRKQEIPLKADQRTVNSLETVESSIMPALEIYGVRLKEAFDIEFVYRYAYHAEAGAAAVALKV